MKNNKFNRKKIHKINKIGEATTTKCYEKLKQNLQQNAN